jgi:hypothetical protein
LVQWCSRERFFHGELWEKKSNSTILTKERVNGKQKSYGNYSRNKRKLTWYLDFEYFVVWMTLQSMYINLINFKEF